MIKHRIFVILLGVLTCCGEVLWAQEDPKKTPYAANTYAYDRKETGPYFRKLRRIREAEGNAAAAARLDGAWKLFLERLQKRLPDVKTRHAFDTWAFWTWHEAEFDSGLNDPEWALLLYQWIYDEAQQRKWPDWVTHVRPNVIYAHSTLCQWAQRRMVMNVAEDYFAGIKFDLDPGKLPASTLWAPDLPYVTMRQFPVIVPSTKHVVPWQRKEQKDSSKPTYMDNLLIGLMEHLALEDYQMGRWDRAMERYLWILEWNSAIGKHNADPKKPYELKREDADAYRNAKLVMAGILDKLGYREKALTLVDQGLERKKKSIYSNKQLKLLEVMRARLTWQQGKGDAALLGKLNAILALEGKDPGVPVGAMDSARLMKADCLASMGRKGEAETLLKGICERKKRSALGWLDAELALVNLDLSQARWASAEKKLHELMQAVRLKGVKIEELDLYQMYVQWALMSGKWEEALRGQREVLRLLEAFRMTPLLPLEQARLARILAELGNIAESEAQAKLAKSGATGRGAHFTDRIEQELNELKNRANVIAKSKVRMQPRSVMTAPIAGFPSRTVLTLINHGTVEAKGAIKVSGLPATITWDEKTSHAVVEVTDAQGGAKEQTSGEIRIAAGRMAQVSCFGKLNSENARKVLLEWVGDDRQSCEWSIENGDKESDGAVIDAGSYDHDPFFMIPVHHHLQCKVKGSVNLRVVTSKPCRVELYDEKGGLQMVDAEGNGSLKDSGDWLGADRDRNLAAEIFADATTGETRFLLLLDPAQEIEKEALKVRVEWLMDGKWYPAAEDQITPGK